MTEIMSKAAKTLCRPSLLEHCLAGSAQCPGSVFTNHSLERSLSYSPEFSMYRSI